MPQDVIYWLMILNVCCLSLSEQDIFFLIRERIEQYFEYLLTTHLKSPVHISILMMKSNPEYEGQIVNKKINVWDEEKTLVSPRAFSPWNLFRLKVFDNSEKSATILLFLAVSVHRWTCFHVHIYLKPINNILNEM